MAIKSVISFPPLHGHGPWETGGQGSDHDNPDRCAYSGSTVRGTPGTAKKYHTNVERGFEAAAEGCAAYVRDGQKPLTCVNG